MTHQRIPLGLYQAPEPLPKGPAEGVFLINLENIDIDQVVAMRVYYRENLHRLIAGATPTSTQDIP